MNVTINGQQAVITVNTDDAATSIVFPNLYPFGPSPDPLSLSFAPAVPVEAAEAAATALLNGLGITG